VVQVETGDTRPYAQRPVPHRHFVFPIQLQPGSDRTLYLRVASGGTVSIPLMLWHPDAFWQNDQVSLGVSALYFGLLAGLLLYNLFLYFSTREPQFLVYVCFSASMGIGQLGLTGLGAQFLWTKSLWLAEYVPRASLAITAFFAAIFVRGLLDTRVRFPRMDVLINTVAGVSLLTLLAVFVLPQLVSAWMINLLSLSVAFTMVGIGVCAYRLHQPGARFFLLAWSALLLGAAVLPLHNLGVLPANVFNRHGLMLGSAIEMLLLSIALADRINTAHREKEAALAQAAESDFARLEVLKASEAELEHRVRLRTLELEEANRRLLENERLLEFRANHDALTGLANRVLLANRVQLAMQRSQRSGQGFALVVLDLDGFKAVNDTHGHACGDDLLLVIAKRLEEVTRGIDTVARVGGDEFVLLLEGLTQPADVWAFASKLLDRIELPVRLSSGVEVTVSASIGHATYPHDAREYDALMKLADAAMYTCKQSRKYAASAPMPLT
jgi:diguanylate cyclase (GGDEF)-like protein